MYVHIGGEYTLSSHFIVGIFDMDAVTVKPEQNASTIFLRRAEEQNRLEMITYEVPRSMVVTLDRVYLSPVSAATLRLRLEQADFHTHSQ